MPWFGVWFRWGRGKGKGKGKVGGGIVEMRWLMGNGASAYIFFK